MNPITLLSPAKVNLTFEIFEKRSDGYHEIKSIMQPVNLFDHVKIEILEGEGVYINSRGIKIPLDDSNLAFQAARLYLDRSHIRKKIDISIDKSIPVGGGLGGGSSNAAAVLVGINRLLNMLDESELMEIAPEIGADVSFFIRCQSAFVEGIGEKITTLTDFPLFYYVVIYPKFEVPTKEVYDRWDRLKTEKNNEKSQIEFDGLNQLFLNSDEDPPVFSDLERPAFELYPVLKEYKQLMLSMEAKSTIISGSGSSVFAVFRKEEPAKDLYNYLITNNNIDTFLLKGISGWHRLAD